MKLKVLLGPARDGGVIGRWVKDLETGELLCESWRGPERGWVDGGIDVQSIMTNPQMSHAAMREAGIPPEDY